MAKINFYLKSVKKNKKGQVPIYVQITHEGEMYRKHIKMIVKKDWSRKKQRARENKEWEPYNGWKETNDLINSYVKDWENLLINAREKSIKLNEDIIRAFLNREIKEGHAIPQFFEAFEQFIEVRKIERADRTIKGYETVKNFLQEFSKEMRFKISFYNIDLVFFDKLKQYAFEVKETKVSDNYFAKIISVLKAFLSWSADREYYSGTKHLKFKAPEKEKDVIFLTMDELFHLYNYDFEKKKHKLARDMYCLGCFTGLRISDLQNLRPEYINNDVLRINIQKTSETESIPLNKWALEIIERNNLHNIRIFPKISVQKLNKNIKECCKIAELNSKEIIHTYSGGKRTEIIKPKHELITMHTARKTFITNSVMLGMNIKAIKNITGHKRDSTFDKYLKIVEQYKREEMEKAWNKLK